MYALSSLDSATEPLSFVNCATNERPQRVSFCSASYFLVLCTGTAGGGFAISLRFLRAKEKLCSERHCRPLESVYYSLTQCFFSFFKDVSVEAFPASGIPAAAGTNGWRT